MRYYEILKEDSTEDRLKRAKEQGFDIDDPHYHGTPGGDFDEFDTGRTADENLAYGKGIYASRDPDAASGYSKPGTSWGNEHEDASPTVYKVFMKVKNPFDLDKRYPYAEIKRIMENSFSEGELASIDFWQEIQEEATFDNRNFDEIEELESRLHNLECADDLPDPGDYEDGVNDEDYIADRDHALDLEEKDIKRRIERLQKQETENIKNHEKALATGYTASAFGKDIYKALWTNTDDYHDWRQESQLFGGETETFEFKSQANEMLEALGYDGIRHIDRYNPGNRGKSHVVTIAFHPQQVRSVHANFALDKTDSPKLHERNINKRRNGLTK